MVGTWVLSKELEPDEFLHLLYRAPFDVVVLVPTAAAADDPQQFVMGLLEHLAGEVETDQVAIADVVSRKKVFRVFGSVFVAVNRLKVKACHSVCWEMIRSCGAGESSAVAVQARRMVRRIPCASAP